jgi:hypothetical protein
VPVWASAKTAAERPLTVTTLITCCSSAARVMPDAIIAPPKKNAVVRPCCAKNQPAINANGSVKMDK